MSEQGRHDNKTVLVSGGSGFLAGWIIIGLLQRGYSVHTTVRDLSRQADIRNALTKAGAPAAANPDRLRFFVATLEHDTGWREAVRGCNYAIHTAAPFPKIQPKDDDKLIIPARDGALRILRASLQAGVPRVVMTSSVAAMEYTDSPHQAAVSEADWTNAARRNLTPYIRAKTLAERAAWEFADQYKGRFSLTTIAPGTMLGPVLGNHVAFSVESIKQLLDGSVPAVPQLGFGFVDVRDVAELHIIAMTAQAAANERFLAGGNFLWLNEVAQMLRVSLPEYAGQIPHRTLPNVAARCLALFNPSLRSIIHDLGKVHDYSPAKAERLLNWTMRPIENTVLATAHSLLDSKIVTIKK